METTVDDFVDKVCRELALVRAEADITPQRVYKQTKINVGRVERHKSDITLATLSKLCECYGISVKDFFLRLQQ